MAKNWQKMDLGAGGVQSVNLQFLRQRRSLGRGFLLWCMFPLAAHQFYLKRPLLGILQTGSLFVGIFLAAQQSPLGMPILVGVLLWYLFDLLKLPRWINDYNKQLRIALHQQSHAAAPQDFKAHYHDEKTESSHTSKRVPSFAEQEALLKQIAEKKKEKL